VLLQAFGINNSGQIVGDGTLNGQNHGFLLTVK
jgi:probable HAF family extracellular repeat protein